MVGIISILLMRKIRTKGRGITNTQFYYFCEHVYIAIIYHTDSSYGHTNSGQ